METFALTSITVVPLVPLAVPMVPLALLMVPLAADTVQGSMVANSTIGGILNVACQFGGGISKM